MNRAAELGPRQFAWWPDWRGECAAIVACGPSTKRMRPELLKDRIHVIAIKETCDLLPFAEVVYGCDGHWWDYRKGLKDHRGVKITFDAGMASRYGLRHAHIDVTKHRILVETPMVIGSGLNSGFQALNLAVQFGATDILLVGYDMGGDPNHPHYYGRSKWQHCSNPMGSNYMAWRKAFQGCKTDLDRLGINVRVVSDASHLDCFYKTPDLDWALRSWGL